MAKHHFLVKSRKKRRRQKQARTNFIFTYVHTILIYQNNRIPHVYWTTCFLHWTEVHSDFHCCATESLELGGLSICDQRKVSTVYPLQRDCGYEHAQFYVCVDGFLFVCGHGNIPYQPVHSNFSNSNVSNLFPHLAAFGSCYSHS